MERGGCVYIITNKRKTTLYIGVTSDLFARMWEHKNNVYPKSFASRYNLHYLVFYEFFPTIEEAILQEKYLKGKKRDFTEKLINELNPDWRDMSEEVG